MASLEDRKPVLLYRDHLLKFSEVWVRSQGEALDGFRAFYAGSKRVGHVETPADRTFLVNRGGAGGAAAEALWKIAGRAPALHGWARAVSPALVHAHFGIDGILMLPVARALGVPLVTTFHGYEVMTYDAYASRSFYLHRKYLRRRAELAQGGTLFIAVSRFLRGLLLEQGFPPDRTVVHYIGVDVDHFTPEPIAPRAPVVLFVGRLAPEKGCAYLIQAMAKVEALHDRSELVIIGDGPMRTELERLASARLPRVRFLGIQPQVEVKRWLNRAAIFSVPSLRVENGEGEAFGLVFAEAQAMGVPVVAFAHGGVCEAVAHGRTGLLVPERDVAGLAQGIGGLLGDPAMWNAFSRAGRARVASEFDLHAQTRKLEGLYRDLLRDWPARTFGRAASAA